MLSRSLGPRQTPENSTSNLARAKTCEEPSLVAAYGAAAILAPCRTHRAGRLAGRQLARGVQFSHKVGWVQRLRQRGRQLQQQLVRLLRWGGGRGLGRGEEYWQVQTHVMSG